MHFTPKAYRNVLIGLALTYLYGFSDFCKVSAQDPVFSQFMFNQLSFNPAFAGNIPYPRFICGYRNQWPQLGNTYVSYYASYDQFVNWLGGGAGINLSRDVQGKGVFSKTSCDLMYSFPIEFSNDLIVNLGLQAGLTQKSVSGTDLVLPDQNPFQSSTQQEFIPNQSKIYPDFAAGTTFRIHEQYQINFSVYHLNNPKETMGSENKFLSPVCYNLQILGKFPAKKGNRNDETGTSIQPGVMAQMQRGNIFFGGGTNVLFSSFMGGIWFRNNISLNINSYIFLAGYTHSGLSLYYSYDLWVPKNNQGFKNYGAHEVTFIYLFQYNDPRKKMRTIKCPKF